MPYAVNSMDDSADGMERLRSQSEFILLAYPKVGETVETLRDEWIADLDSCMRPDGFDFAAAEQAIRDYCEERSDYLVRCLADLPAEPDDDADEPDFDESPVTFRLYVEEGGDAD